MCARDITDTFATAMYTVGDHILGTDLFRIEIYADQMCHVNAASVAQCVCVSSSKVAPHVQRTLTYSQVPCCPLSLI